MRSVVCTAEQGLWLSNLDDDVRSAQISYVAYAAAARRILRKPKNVEMANAQAFHHARAFVTACRRVGRLLETVNVSIFPTEVATVVKLQKKAKRHFFEPFVAMRDISEHIAEKVKVPGKFLVNGIMMVNPGAQLLHPLIIGMGISESKLVVPNLGFAPVTNTALETVVSTRDEIIGAVVEHFPKRTTEVFMVLPLGVEGFAS